MIAYCGIECHTCPIHMATVETNKEVQAQKRTEIARILRELYSINHTPEEITDCDGCKAINVRLYVGCLDCEIRKCGIERKLENCGFCKDYACEKLTAFLTKEPEAKKYLEKVRNSLK